MCSNANHASKKGTAEYPAILSYTPEKAGYMDTQLSPANALRTRNTYMSYLSGVGYAATRLRSSLDRPSPLECGKK